MLVPCDICGSSESRVLFDQARNNERVQNVICARCGLVYVLRHDGDTAGLQRQYADGGFSIRARGGLAPSREKQYRSEQMALDRFKLLSSVLELRTNRTGRVLEIGCGMGSFLRLMRGAGWTVTGVEPDGAYAGAGEAAYGIVIHHGFYETIELPPASFDMAAAFHVLEHVPSPKEFLVKVGKEIEKGGRLYLEVPCIERPYGGDLKSFFWSAHLFTFSKRTLTGLLDQTGFKPMGTGYTGNFLWMVAEKTGKTPAGGHLKYPYDRPDRTIKHAHGAWWMFQRLTAVGMRPDLVSAAINAFGQSFNMLDRCPRKLWPLIVRKCRALRTRISIKAYNSVRRRDRGHIAHFGLHAAGNSGDVMLSVAVRRLFDAVCGRQKWSLEPLWQEGTAGDLGHLAKSKGILIGGGGVLLRDTNPNENSGWQWNFPIELLKRLDVPIVVFGIGYNRFRGQDDFSPVFRLHMRELVRRSAFFGLRNHGSIRQLSRYLDETSAAKLTFQPCPTTLLRYLYPRYASRSVAQREGRTAAFNMAFDRSDMRYGRSEDRILGSIASVMAWMNREGWRIKLVRHCGGDDSILPWLIREKVNYEEADLVGRPYRDIMDFYRGVSLAVGMRGHSQMIPFGLGVPIVSVISHDKLGYFLEDVGHPEWGVDIHAADLEEQLKEKIRYADKNQGQIHEQIVHAQRALWDVTLHNLDRIRSVFKI